MAADAERWLAFPTGGRVGPTKFMDGGSDVVIELDMLVRDAGVQGEPRKAVLVMNQEALQQLMLTASSGLKTMLARKAAEKFPPAGYQNRSN